MSVFTSSHRAASGKGRGAPGVWQGEAKPIRLTVRRVKFGGILLLGALMVRIVDNAMLTQPGHAPAPTSNAALARARPEPSPPVALAKPVASVALAEVPEAAPAPVADPGVDRRPVGTIAPPRPKHAKLRAASPPTRGGGHSHDAITAFLHSHQE